VIKLEIIAPGVLKIITPVKLTIDDIAELTPKVDSILKRAGKIRLLIDASRLEGWENTAALERHAAFVKARQQEVERVAVIVAHEWQHWLVGAVKVFLHPAVRVFDRADANATLKWIAD
jgi:hypothetical protein